MKALSRAWMMVALVALAGAGRLHSQNVAAVKTPVEHLHAFKALNQQMLEKQAASLLKLEELEKQAAQLKIFAKRS